MRVSLKQYLGRLTSSERGEPFNPLIPPFLLSTLAYGISFMLFIGSEAVGSSSLFISMNLLHPVIPVIWGGLCVITIVVGVTFLLFNIPPAGKASGLLGFMLWLFASFCWVFTGSFVQLFAIGFPNMWFWIWQYLSLSLFRREDAADKATMEAYDRGEYDDDDGGKEAREDNRGVDRQ